MKPKRSSNLFLWACVLLLVMMFAFMIGGGAAQAQTCSATLTWTPPTENTDGSPLEDLAGFRVYWGTSSGQYPMSAQLDNPSLTSYIVGNLSAATWYFVATAFNESGIESSFSNEASKTTIGCVALPDPRPPDNVLLTTTQVVAYQYLAQTDRAVMLPVGEVPDDTVCDGDEMVVAGGVPFYAVPRDVVAWYGNVEPAAVYARCAG